MFLLTIVFVLTCIVASLGQQYSSLAPYSVDGPAVSSTAISQLRTSDFTFIVTIQPEIIPKDNATYGAVINKGVKQDEDSFHLELHFDGRLVAYGLNISGWVNFEGISPSPNGECSVLTSNTMLQPNEIYEIAIVRNQESFLLYINGKLDISVIASVYDSVNKHPITVGMQDKIGHSVFQGNIWGIKIFQQALTPDQIRQQSQGADDDDSEVEEETNDDEYPYKSQNGKQSNNKIDDESSAEEDQFSSDEVQDLDSEFVPQETSRKGVGACRKCPENAKCVVTNGKKACVCNAGYRMDRDGKTCAKKHDMRQDSTPAMSEHVMNVLPTVVLVIICVSMALVAKPVIIALCQSRRRRKDSSAPPPLSYYP